MSHEPIRSVRPGAQAVVAGRVVGGDPEGADGARFRLRDASGEVLVATSRPMPPLGAWVRVAGSLRDDHVLVAGALEIVGTPALRPGESPEWAEAGAERRLGELRARAAILRAWREWFHREGFLEVETPLLLPAPGQEPHLLPFATSFHGRAGARPLWLATSPEYAMKRLLARGCERIYQLGRSFRDGRDEHSPLHAPEFALLEWYRAFDDLAALGRDVEALLGAAADAVRGAQGRVVGRGGRACDLGAGAEWLPVERAFRELAGVDLAPYLDGDDAAFVRGLPAGWRTLAGDARAQADSAYFRLLVERIEPALGIGRPTFLHRYPARHAALAELCRDDPRVAERFETYVAGIELSNGFLELRDAAEQERRLRAEQAERVAAGGAALPICADFLRALRSGLPPCAGIALGVDRVHLLVTGAARIADVVAIPFPAED